MIRIKMRRGIISRLCITGHSGYAEKGSDIVCAGVSALTDALAEVTGAQVRDDGEVYMCAFLANTAAFDMARCGYMRIAAAYPEHVSVEIE